MDDEVEEETQEQSEVQDTKQNDAADIKINVKLPESDSKAENIENKQDNEDNAVPMKKHSCLCIYIVKITRFTGKHKIPSKQ